MLRRSRVSGQFKTRDWHQPRKSEVSKLQRLGRYLATLKTVEVNGETFFVEAVKGEPAKLVAFLLFHGIAKKYRRLYACPAPAGFNVCDPLSNEILATLPADFFQSLFDIAEPSAPRSPQAIAKGANWVELVSA